MLGAEWQVVDGKGCFDSKFQSDANYSQHDVAAVAPTVAIDAEFVGVGGRGSTHTVL